MRLFFYAVGSLLNVLYSQCLFRKYLIFNGEYFAFSTIIPHIVNMC